MQRRPHRKKGQELEPIAGSWLQAAMEARDLSVVQVQRQIESRGVTVARQTLSYVLAGQQRTVRADVRQALAKVLRVSEGFLAGMPQGAGAWARTLDAQPWSPAVALSVMEFTSRCEAAWRREMIAAHPALADVPVSQDPRSPWAEHLGRDVRVPFALYELARGDVWRRRFLHGAPALTAAERERATGHLTAAFDVLFAPWFAGTATLNRDALLQWWDEVTRERVQPAVPPTAPARPTSGRKGSSTRRIR